MNWLVLNLSTPIEQLSKVGPKFLSRLKNLGIKTVRDLLWHFPVRYDDYTEITPISEIIETGQKVNIVGKIKSIELVRSWRRKMIIVTATVVDDSSDIRAVWFNQPYLIDILKEDTVVSLAGKVYSDKKGLYLSSPTYEKISNIKSQISKNFQNLNSQNPKSITNYQLPITGLTHTARLVPIYPETEGLSSKYLRFLIKPLLDKIEELPDPIPKDLLNKYGFPGIGKALRSIHFPEKVEQAEPARQRFAFEELLLFQLRTLRDHRQLQISKAPAIKFNSKLIANFVKSLPFELTKDQRIAAYEILQDLERTFPMNRLINGDVGSGKTIVAVIAAYQVVNAGYQAVFMAPTEILAKQHYQTITKLLARIFNFRGDSATNGNKIDGIFNEKSLLSNKILNSKIPIKIGLLTGTEAKQWPGDKIENEKIAKNLMRKKISSGEITIVIGTHSVIQKDIKFNKLGLVVIDEQHRFGIEQRMKLVKNYNQAPHTDNLVPHLLSMTATPIPRSLALTIYGDLDVSLLKEKPKGRQKIITKVVPHAKRMEAHKFIDEQIARGKQVFVICPRIEAKGFNPNNRALTTNHQQNKLGVGNWRSAVTLAWAEVKAVEEEYKKLSEEIFPYRKVAMLHGKMKPKEKEEIMAKFKNGHYDILVSTSVVEVGVDIQNATLIMIESAERFGLAQLHQFRGRVGRGEDQSYCFLFTTNADVPTTQRLRAMEKIDDGFQLAETDLKIRGPGEFAGIKQSGLPDFAMSSLADIDLIKKARLEARLLLKEDPALKKNPLLKQRVDEFQKLTHFE